MQGAGIARLERFGVVTSTQAIVREWLEAGEAELCVAVADEQTAGRGRLERSWQAPPRTSLLLSVGFRPVQVPLMQTWRVAAVVTLAMREAALEASGLVPAAIGLKWPNDLVGRDSDRWRKLAGVLSDGVPIDGRMAMLVVGIGVNVDWRRSGFPAELAEDMTSLRELAGGRVVRRDGVLDRFLERIPVHYAALSRGDFDVGTWSEAQITTGADVSVDTGAGVISGHGEAPDPDTGELRVRDRSEGVLHSISVGDVVRCRIDEVGPHL